MSRRAVFALGLGQCLNWGVLYYAFAVLMVPVSRELGVAAWWVTGAFSAALLTSAALSPLVGRWTDPGHGPTVMVGGGGAAVHRLATWTTQPGLAALYFIWIGLGACMAATLYEPAFAIVVRAMPPGERLRALALVTVMGGLASTIFLPLTDLLVRTLGSRGALLVLALLLAGSALLTHLALRSLPLERIDRTSTHVGCSPSGPSPLFGWAVAVFAFGSFASAGLTANLVPALAVKRVSASNAALLGGILGVMQLPGRLLLSMGALSTSAIRLVIVSLLLQAAGFLALSAASSTAAVATALVVFAMGAGLATLARPHLLQSHFEVQRAGHLNGRLARWQHLARAAGPLAAASAASLVGYGAVLGLLGVLFLSLIAVSLLVVDRPVAASLETRG
jgi:hypothetical protein